MAGELARLDHALEQQTGMVTGVPANRLYKVASEIDENSLPSPKVLLDVIEQQITEAENPASTDGVIQALVTLATRSVGQKPRVGEETVLRAAQLLIGLLDRLAPETTDAVAQVLWVAKMDVLEGSRAPGTTWLHEQLTMRADRLSPAGRQVLAAWDSPYSQLEEVRSG